MHLQDLSSTFGSFTIERYSEDIPKEKLAEIRKIVISGLNIEYKGPRKELIKKGITLSKSVGDEYAFYISPISRENVFSTGYFPCTGIILTEAKKSKTEPALCSLTHQHSKLLSTTRDQFSQCLESRIIQLQKLCKPNNVVAGFFGGMKASDGGIEKFTNYLDILEHTKSITQKHGIQLEILNHPIPWLQEEATNVFIDTRQQIIYIIESEKIIYMFDQKILRQISQI